MMRSCKSLRRARVGLKSPLRASRSNTRNQHIAALENIDTSNESYSISLALRMGLLAVASFVGTISIEQSSEYSAEYSSGFLTKCDFDEECGVHYETEQHLTNWSSTVSCLPSRMYEPKNAQEVVRVLKTHHDSAKKIRPIGQALSPNGLGMSNNDVISLSAIDYVEVDKERSLVTVGAGAKVSTVLKELKAKGLTLQNFSSIQEQQIGGWMQVAAHGTGVSLPTVEEMIINMKMATPTEGLITLNKTANPKLFNMAKVGLGSLGVVTEMTLQCIPQMNLLEHTTTCDRNKMNIKDHVHRLRTYRHVRYMWIPYTNTVVTVVSNPTKEQVSTKANGGVGELPTKPLSDLLLTLDNSLDPISAPLLSFSQLRDALLDMGPLDVEHIKKVNKAEAQFWRASEGQRQGDSTDILGFDCGGEQLVMEFCFPIGTLTEQKVPSKEDKDSKKPAIPCVADGKDLMFVQKLLALVEKAGIPAPSPIEQRWTASSTACMSPAHSPRSSDLNIFSWVGVIMYLPPNQTEEQREAIKAKFEDYLELIRPLLEEYNAHAHWAKIEIPGTHNSAATQPLFESPPEGSWANIITGISGIPGIREITAMSGISGVTGDRPLTPSTPLTPEEKLAKLQYRLAAKYPLKEFNAYRSALDPNNILSNKLIDTLITK